MADVADVSDVWLDELDALITAKVNSIPTKSSIYCEDCGEEIPLARREAIKTTRCISCQEIYSLRNRR